MTRVSRATATLAIGMLLVGCSGEDPAEEAVERAVDEAGAEDVDIDLDDGNVTIETDEMTVESGTGADLPDGWPEEFPLPDGYEVMAGGSTNEGSGDIFVATFMVPGRSFDEVLAELDAGFDANAWEVTGNQETGTGEVTGSGRLIEGHGWRGTATVVDRGDGAVMLNVSLSES